MQPDNQPDAEATGAAHPETIDEAVAGIDDLADVPLTEHVARFDAVHSALNHALSRIDTE